MDGSALVQNQRLRKALTLDGSFGEGGGQILRTSLSLSVITGRPFILANIRGNRSNPGLQPQHLSAVRAAASISNARVSGDDIGSRELSFAPGAGVVPGHYRFDIAEIAERGSAGSVNLLLQTLLVPLARATSPSVLTLRGGTHVQGGPSFDDIENAYLPVLRRMGVSRRRR
jgi:RNA 3'-terminal phosphate cyclase (ATP)